MVRQGLIGRLAAYALTRRPHARTPAELEACVELAVTFGATARRLFGGPMDVLNVGYRRLRRHVYREIVQRQRFEQAGASGVALQAVRIPVGPEYLAAQVSSLSDEVRYGVWMLPLLPTRFVSWAARCQDTRMRLEAASYEECPTSLLEELCHDGDPAVARAAISSLTGAEADDGALPGYSEDPPDPF